MPVRQGSGNRVRIGGELGARRALDVALEVQLVDEAKMGVRGSAPVEDFPRVLW